QYLPKGKDEYYLRNEQNKNGIAYRHLTAGEIETLVRNRNTSDEWNLVLVSNAFTADLVMDCKFFGLVRIGKLEPLYLEFNNLRRPVGLYNSTIISTDFGDNVVIDNVNYLSHYIVGNEVMIVNTNEVATTDHSKFGNGILKEGESESVRIRLEICNENGGRSVIPFDGMLPGDAFLWSRFRDDRLVQERFTQFTEKKFDDRRGYYGMIGDRTVIKNCRIIKDVIIGSDAYLKGANKLKNLTINSSAEAISQIGEGCELVNGIVDYGCRIFYGVKAVRFILASNSQLKYGARLINSYLGNNSTISCCEVLNSLIFPAHEQHHNNSFLCAALVNGQSNMAAGATIGSNHNSRSPDGEIIAGRGFWPGLSVSLKHNSRFASFCILAKGAYPAELDIRFPFSLVSNNESQNELVIMPAYWFMYNMYALARNAWKYKDRDKRYDKTQVLEYDFLAPDTINEILGALDLLELNTGMAYHAVHEKGKKFSANQLMKLGAGLLEESQDVVDGLAIFADGAENSKRKTRLIKVYRAYHLFRDLVKYYAIRQLLNILGVGWKGSMAQLSKNIPPRTTLTKWLNVGGQLIPEAHVERFLQKVHAKKIDGWGGVHLFYEKEAAEYNKHKFLHSLAALKKVHGIDIGRLSAKDLSSLLQGSIATEEWITKCIHDSRAKDYTNPFRKMTYRNSAEMNKVTGSLRKNAFVRLQVDRLLEYKRQVKMVSKNL
ncbi:MAG TPA: DUF4954 family protein, partial [Puia sp.]|nr:DUF4954 family protein [Puia sp.]